jgi:hypothetical protein
MRGRGREKIGAEAAGDEGWGREREKRGGEGGEESSVKQREREVWRTCERENINYEMCE